MLECDCNYVKGAGSLKAAHCWRRGAGPRPVCFAYPCMSRSSASVCGVDTVPVLWLHTVHRNLQNFRNKITGVASRVEIFLNYKKKIQLKWHRLVLCHFQMNINNLKNCAVGQNLKYTCKSAQKKWAAHTFIFYHLVPQYASKWS